VWSGIYPCLHVLRTWITGVQNNWFHLFLLNDWSSRYWLSTVDGMIWLLVSWPELDQARNARGTEGQGSSGTYIATQHKTSTVSTEVLGHLQVRFPAPLSCRLGRSMDPEQLPWRHLPREGLTGTSPYLMGDQPVLQEISQTDKRLGQRVETPGGLSRSQGRNV